MFEQYPIEFKYIPVEAMLFFSELKKLDNGKNNTRTIMEFCQYYKDKYQTAEFPQPQIVARICDKLVENNQLSITNSGGFNNIENSYFCLLTDKSFSTQELLFEFRNIQLSCLVYGFKYIYEYYREYVLPVLHINKDDDKSIGSSFLFQGGILTAKHCIENAKKIAIKGIKAEELKQAKFYIFDNASMDLVYIKLSEEILNSVYFDSEIDILEEVIALGYPQIPGFHNFLTAEMASVSGRFTATKGNVTSIAEDIWMKEKLILITAKIRGGNSGGPIINNKGMVIGIASNIPTGEGKYDDLGYGTVIPIKFAKEIINNLSTELSVTDIEFIDFIE